MAITFTFPKDVVGLAGAFRPIRQGADFVIPMLDLGSLPRQLTATAMAAAASYTEGWQDRMDDAYVTRIRALALADQSGTAYIESSPDAVAATVLWSSATVANTPLDSGWINMTPGHRWYRRRYVNGATGQGLFFYYSAIEVARGDHAPPIRGILTDRSGTITTGSTSQQLAAANPTRRYLYVENVHASADLWINFTNAAALAQPSILIKAGLTYVMDTFVSTEVVNVISATAGHPFVAKEG